MIETRGFTRYFGDKAAAPRLLRAGLVALAGTVVRTTMTMVYLYAAIVQLFSP